MLDSTCGLWLSRHRARRRIRRPRKVRTERDLYLRLPQLGTHAEIDPFLRDALAPIVEAIGARLAYPRAAARRDRARSMRWFAAHGLAGRPGAVRGAISSGIIAEVLATAPPVTTPSALLDLRFADRGQRARRPHRGRAVRTDRERNATGARHLQGHSGAGPFSERDRATVELSHGTSPARRPPRQRAPSRERSDARRPRAPALRRRDRPQPGTASLLAQAALIAPLDERASDRRVRHRQEPDRTRDPRQQPARGPFVELNCARCPST